MVAPDKLARIFKVLSVDTRVRMISLLKQHPRCVNALAHHLGISAAAASQHLRILRDADLVTADKRGYFVHYRLREETLAEWGEAANSLLGAAAQPPERPKEAAHGTTASEGEESETCLTRRTLASIRKS